MKSQSNRFFKYPIDAITICALMILFRSDILLFLGYAANTIGFRDIPLIGTYVFYGAFIIALFTLIVGNYRANIRVDARKIILPFVICAINALSVLYTLLLNRYIFMTVSFDVTGYVVFLPIVAAVFCRIQDYEKLVYWMTVVARFAWTMPFLVIYLEYMRSGGVFENYDMVGGYELIFCSMILLHSVFRKLNCLDLLLCIVTFIVALGCGSRGAVLAFLIDLGILLFCHMFRNKKQIDRILFAAAGLAVILVTAIYFDAIVFELKHLFNRVGINTRTLDSVLGGNIAEGSNGARKAMYKEMTGTWKTMPVFGHGILYDRLVLGGYCHNIVIEIITDYGLIIGTVFILWFIDKAVGALMDSDAPKKSFFVMLMIFTLMQLLVSGTYLTSNVFFALVGTIAVTSRNTRNRHNLFRTIFADSHE